MNIKSLNIKSLLVSFFVFVSFSAQAALDIEISGGGAQQIPIAVVPFDQSAASAMKQDMASIISADLKRSGLFRALDVRGMPSRPSDASQIKFSEWTALQAQAIVVGKIRSAADGRYVATFQLADAVKQTKLADLNYQFTSRQARITAHKIADVIYEKLTGEKGAFASRIAYITKLGKRYALRVADADGFNPQTVVSSNEPIISPAWSPDGKKMAYVSFEKKKPIVYVQSLTSGKRKMVANYKGNNSAPAWSPDGSKLAIVLTYGANSQIYTINSSGGGLKRITRSRGIDTEPVFSPDGSSIYFSSDRGGSPQIYKTSAHGGSATRVTFGGSYNVSPQFSPDGKSLAYIQNDGGGFKVAIQDLATRQVQILSEGRADESPSFAPNGRMIMYATKAGSRGALAAVSFDGKVRQKLSESSGDVREPAWGPLIN